MVSQTHAQGNRSLAAVIHALTERGFEVFTPFGDGTAIDLVVALTNGPLLRAQVKTGRVTTSKHSRRVTFSTSSLHWRKKSRVGYQGKADLFIVWCPETARCYCVPVRETGSSSFSISIDHPAPFDLEGFDFNSIFGEVDDPRRLKHDVGASSSEGREVSSVSPINRNLGPSKQVRVREYVMLKGEDGFRLHDAKNALPDISAATIQLVLATMRREGVVEMGPLSALHTTWRTVHSPEVVPKA